MCVCVIILYYVYSCDVCLWLCHAWCNVCVYNCDNGGITCLHFHSSFSGWKIFKFGFSRYVFFLFYFLNFFFIRMKQNFILFCVYSHEQFTLKNTSKRTVFQMHCLHVWNKLNWRAKAQSGETRIQSHSLQNTRTAFMLSCIFWFCISNNKVIPQKASKLCPYLFEGWFLTTCEQEKLIHCTDQHCNNVKRWNASNREKLAHCSLHSTLFVKLYKVINK